MITIDRNAFASKFATAALVVPAKTTKDVLKSVLLTGDGHKIYLSSSDSEMHLRTELPYEGPAETALIPAARMLGILRELEGEQLKLTIKPGTVRIQCGSADFNLGCQLPADFPPVPVFDADAYFTVDPMAFQDCIKKTIFSTDTKSSRYALGGIQLEFVGESMTLSSTDSSRLSTIATSASKVNNPEWGDDAKNGSIPVIPVSAMRLIEKTLEPGVVVKIAIQKSGVSFKIDETSISTMSIQGRFPDYKKVIPESNLFTRKLTIPVGPFASILKQVMIMVSEESRGIDFKFGSGILRVSSKSADIGDGTAEMPLANDQEPITITLAGPYVSEMLKCLDPTATVDVGIIAADERALFTSGNYRHVVMPISKD